MKAIVKPRPVPGKEWPAGVELRDIPEPEIEHPEDIKIRVVSAGICGTDVGIYQSRSSVRNTMSRAIKDEVVIGHEFCGIPVEAGTHARVRLARILGHTAGHDTLVSDFISGRTVTEVAGDIRLMDFLGEHFYCSAEMHITCGWCHQCRMGERHVCQNTIIKGVHDDGAFAEYVVVPAWNLLLFRHGEIPVEIIAFMDALGNAVHTVQSVDIAGKSVAVLGCGVQGLMATAVARHSGASHIYVTDFTPPSSTWGSGHIEETLFSMARHFGADHCFDLALPEARERLSWASKRKPMVPGWTLSSRCRGAIQPTAMRWTWSEWGGTLALLGLPEGEFNIDFAREVIFRGITIKGIVGRRVFETWEVMRNLLRSGLADEIMESNFVSHRLGLEDFTTGIEAILRRDATKVILNP